MTTRLLTIAEAAAELGVPARSLRGAAEQHGLLVRIGRAIRIDPQTLPELVEKCRDREKVPACGSAATMAAGSSSTAQQHIQRARETAEKLKRRSPATSPKKAGQLVQLPRSK